MSGNIIVAGHINDKKIIMESATKKLEGTQVQFVNGKTEILDMMKIQDFHICIINENKFDEDMYSFLEKILKEAELRNILTIICSENDDKCSINKALDMGVYDYFIKPFSEIDLNVILPLKIKNGIKLMKKQKYVNYLSYHDELTELYNRRFFDEEIRRLDTKRQLPISVIFSDINNFKDANDLYGHELGDEVLKNMASILKNTCREEDIIARWGGDEFTVLLPQTGEKEVRTICKRIESNCKVNCGKLLNTTLALGYSTKENSSEKMIDIIRKAEEWMYIHKLLERNK